MNTKAFDDLSLHRTVCNEGIRQMSILHADFEPRGNPQFIRFECMVRSNDLHGFEIKCPSIIPMSVTGRSSRDSKLNNEILQSSNPLEFLWQHVETLWLG